MITAEFIYAKNITGLSPATELSLADGRLSIAKSDVGEGELRRYQVTVNGTTIRFLLYRKPNGEIATVFDACAICGPVGFYKASTGIVCKNCAAPINSQSVGQPGGCNPIPLKSTESGDRIVITAAGLAEQAGVFSQ